MSKYINADAFKEQYLCCGYLPEMSEAEFDSFPAADVAEIKHGHWIFHRALDRIVDDDYFECSLCGYKTYDWDEPPYCPNCATKMDEEEK